MIHRNRILALSMSFALAAGAFHQAALAFDNFKLPERKQIEQFSPRRVSQKKRRIRMRRAGY